MTFITFEGGDGAGKSTLIDKVAKELAKRGLPFLATRAPGGTELGKAIRSLLLHQQDLEIVPRAELLLFLADRAQHVDQVIKPALEEGKIVLCDRYNDSTLAYQAGARKLSYESVASLTLFASSYLQPDRTFYLDIDPLIALKRIPQTKDRMEQEALLFHRHLREAFLTIAKEDPKRVQLLDATLSPTTLFEQTMQVIDELL